MSSPHQARRAEEKLGLILGRIGAIRGRLNSLAWQRAAFSSLGWLIAIGAIVMLAAFYLSPLIFLITAAMLAMVLMAGLVNSIGAGWRMHVNQGAAASIADRRADLRGRLETIVELGQRRKVIEIGALTHHPMLWSYLIEDTLSRQEEFEPRRIEARLVSRSIYGLLGALALAALIFPLVMRLRTKAGPIAAGQDEITMDLNDLHLRAADGDSDDGVEVHADARTMRRLEEKLAAQGTGASGKSSDAAIDKMMNHARDFAGRIQNKLTGRTGDRPRITLKLADASDDLNSSERRGQLNLNPNRKEENADAHFEHEQNNGDTADPGLPKAGDSAHSTDQRDSADARSLQDSTAQRQAAQGSDNSSDRSSDENNNEQGGNGGSAHGVGADPGTLFGSASNPRLSGQGFEISIDARAETRGPTASGHAYLPPKVRTPLNPSQHPDEPIARVSVPAQDRAAIKRVFER